MDEELGVAEALNEWSFDAQLLDDEVACLKCVANNLADCLLSLAESWRASRFDPNSSNLLDFSCCKFARVSARSARLFSRRSASSPAFFSKAS